MGSPTELAQQWDVLSDFDLESIELMAVNQRMIEISPQLAAFLIAALVKEVKHRTEMATKPVLLPNFDDWSDSDVAGAYMACVAIERGSEGGSEVMKQWAHLLMRTVCLEMHTRLSVRAMRKPGHV